jgi:CDP-diglyceride synthetase
MAIITQKHFDTYQDDIIQATTVFTLILLAVFIAGHTFFKDDKRKLAWIISLFASGSMSIAGVIYLFHQVPKYNIFSFLVGILLLCFMTSTILQISI